MTPFTSDTDRAEDGLPPVLMPPPEHRDKLLHWLQGETHPEVVEWRFNAWRFIGNATYYSSSSSIATHYRYLGPAEWHPPLYMERSLKAEIASLKDRLCRIAEICGGYPPCQAPSSQQDHTGPSGRKTS